ncbi:MAG: twin-arginine translocase TatA/TatE family subunit [Aggregatilineaceae bacterium]
MGNLGTTELVLILAVVILLFGVGRVSRIGGEMGAAIREFRKGLRGEAENDDSQKS